MGRPDTLGMLRSTITLAAAGIMIAIPISGHAQLQLSGSQAARFTDNAARTAANENSDLESRTSLTAGYETDPGKCSARFSGTISYSIWQNNSFDDETRGNMNLDSECELATGFYWELDNNLREVRQDLTQSDTPTNRTRKNVFSTGPRYVWRLGSTDSIAFSTRYENTEFEEPEQTDSDRIVSSIAWSHLFSQTLSGGLTTSYSIADLDTGAEVSVRTAQATFNKQWATTTVSGALGVSEIETRQAGRSPTSDGIVAEVDLTRELNPSTNWYLRGARELTDRSSSFDIRFEEFEFNLSESITVQTTTVSTGINKSFSDRGSLNINIFATQADFLETNQLEERAGLDLGYSRPITSRVSGDTLIGYRYQAFEEDNSDDEAINLQFGLNYLASRDLSISARVGHEQKTSDVLSREYTEFWAQVGVEYRFR